MTYYRFVKDDELYHHGVIGQKRGVRRYQYEDGSLTPAGRERYGVGQRRINRLEKKSLRLQSKAVKEYKKLGGEETTKVTRSGRIKPVGHFKKAIAARKKQNAVDDKIQRIQAKRRDLFVGEKTLAIDEDELKSLVESFDENRSAFDEIAKDVIEKEVGDVFERFSEDDINRLYDTAYNRYIDYKNSKKDDAENDSFIDFAKQLTALDYGQELSDIYEETSDVKYNNITKYAVNKGVKQVDQFSKESPEKQLDWLKNMNSENANETEISNYNALQALIDKKFGSWYFNTVSKDAPKEYVDAYKEYREYLNKEVNEHDLLARKKREEISDEIDGIVLRNLGLDDNKEAREAIKRMGLKLQNGGKTCRH